MTKMNTTSWKKKLIIGAVAVSTLAGAGVVSAEAHGWKNGPRNGEYGQMEGRGMGDFSGKRLERFLDKIDATDEQKAKITAIFDEAQKDMKALRDANQASRKDTREELATLLKAPVFDREAVQKLMESNNDMRGQGRPIMEKAFLDAAEVLTAEQRAKIADLAPGRGGMFFGGKGGQGHGPRN